MIQSISDATGSVIEALKREPLSLALVIMNVALLFMFYVIMTTIATNRQRELDLIYNDHKEVRELLARCMSPGRGGMLEWPSLTQWPLPEPTEGSGG